MALLLDGMEYDVKTPEENVDDLITFINDYCAANNVTNSLGEVIYIENTEANPFYMLAYGLSYLTTVMQKLIYNAGCAISLSESSPRQLLNLSDIAGIKRATATRTVIQGVVYAQQEIEDTGTCVITQNLEATITIAGMDVTFHPAFDVTIPAGESRAIVLIAEQYGSYSIAANTITQFDDTIPGFRMMATSASTPGQDMEPIASLRARLQRRSVEGTQTDRAAAAIQSLEGVAMCNIYFNYSPREVEYVAYGDSSITVQPRTALLIVQGWSNDIAKVFYRYLFCATSGGDVPGAQALTYTTKAGQELTIYVVPPHPRSIYINVYIKNRLSYEQVDGIKDVICSLAGTLAIGQELSSADVINVVSSNYSNLTVQGSTISLTGADGTYAYKQTPEATDVLIFNADNIHVIEV